MTTSTGSTPIIGDLNFFSEILKKSGYRSVAFGVAEIVDNSIDAGARDILIVLSAENNKIFQIGFLDNGSGMSRSLLKSCLQVGAHFAPPGGRRRGKYGFGLPGASAAHSNVVEVYSWAEEDSVRMTRLDVDNLNIGIPKPASASLPEPFAKLRKKSAVIKVGRSTVFGPVDFKSHGTLVLWKGCERVTPKNPRLLHERYLEPDLGRLFRHFLTQDAWSKQYFDSCNITIAWNLGEGLQPAVHPLKPNDPLYLMSDHRLAEDNVMFRERPEFAAEFELNGSVVDVRFSLSSKAVRDANKGSGKPLNAKIGANTGISIVREGREIDFGDFGLYPSPLDGRHRWWGCEVFFTSEADAFFGVPANKQLVDKLRPSPETEDESFPENAEPGDLPIWLALFREFKLKSVLGDWLKEIKKGFPSETPEQPDDEPVDDPSSDLVDDPEDDDAGTISGGTDVSPEDETARANAVEAMRAAGVQNPTSAQIERYIKSSVVLEYVPLGTRGSLMDISITYGVCFLRINNESLFYEKVLGPLRGSGDSDAEEMLRAIELVFLAYAREMDREQTFENQMFPRVLSKWAYKSEALLRDHFEG